MKKIVVCLLAVITVCGIFISCMFSTQDTKIGFQNRAKYEHGYSIYGQNTEVAN